MADYRAETFLPSDIEGLKKSADPIRELYGGFNDSVNEMMDIIAMDPKTNSHLWSIVQEISAAMVPITYTLATIFIIITLINRAALLKINSWEAVAKILMTFLIGKLVIDHSSLILHVCYQVVADAIRAIPTQELVGADSAQADAMVAAFQSQGWIKQEIMKIQLMPMGLLMWVIKAGINLIAYGRIIEIYVYTAIAPLALSTVVSEDHSHIAKKFIQGYVAVCLQGFIMLLSCVLYTGLVAEFIDPSSQGNMSGVFGMLLSGAVLLFVLVKSGSWAKQITGAM